MIKVLHYGIGSNLGGIETYLQKISKFIDHSRFQFDFVVSGDTLAPGFEKFIQNGSKFYFISSRRENPTQNRTEFEQIIINNHYDIIHCHLLSLSYALPIRLGLKYDIPVIVHSHSSKSPKSIITRSLHFFNKKWLKGKDVKALAVSKLAADWMFDTKTDVDVINNGIEISKYKFNISDRETIRKELQIHGKYVVIHIGTLKEVKNHNFLLEVFSKIKKNIPNSVLLLVGGDGNIREKINKQIIELNLQDSVIFTGTRMDIPMLLSASDGLVFPSFYEGFPGAVIEAQTSGLPTVISDTITDEVIITPLCKSLSLNKTSEEWANELLEIPKYENRENASKEVDARGLSVQKEIKKIERIYSEILG
ncbi:glycosyltransferase [Aerococcus viridans]|uniref:glycosyltransferase n=1 Tax=Aerococcus viridans TaxID=1377 RepID=UPI00223BAFD7|nr:glycosyltransferase [Aerococcus viridans]MCT1797321.1 glycosyltransferase [Aerococcus viridans]